MPLPPALAARLAKRGLLSKKRTGKLFKFKISLEKLSDLIYKLFKRMKKKSLLKVTTIMTIDTKAL